MLAVLTIAAVGAVFWHLFVVPLTTQYGIFSNGIDTKVYWGGATALLEGRPLYDGPVFQVWQYTYTPFAALTMLPLGFTGPLRAVHLMSVVNVVCLVLLVGLTLRALGYARDGRFWAATAAGSVALTLIEPVRTTLWNGQINLILAVLVVGCLTLPTGRWRGIRVGLAAGIKLTPLFFVGYLAVTRQWRAVVVALLTFGATVVIGLAALREQAWRFWTVAVHDTSRIGPIAWPPNQSLNGFFHRLGTMGLWQAPDWLWLPVGVVLGLLGLYTVWRAHAAGATMLAITVAGLTSCAISPFAWGHHWVWMAPLILITLAQAGAAARAAAPLTWLWWLAPAGITLLTFAFRVDRIDDHGVAVWRFGFFRFVEVWSPHGWSAAGALLSSGAYPAVYLATLAVTLWWTARREPIRFNASIAEPAAAPH